MLFGRILSGIYNFDSNDESDYFLYFPKINSITIVGTENTLPLFCMLLSLLSAHGFKILMI